jgi:hypothetical protein
MPQVTVREENGLWSVVGQRRVTLVRHDTDDVEPFRLGCGDADEQALAHGGLQRKGFRLEQIVDDDPLGRGGLLVDIVVGVGERAALEQARPQRLEVARQHQVEVGLPKRARVGERRGGAPSAVDQPAVEGQWRRGCHRLDARNDAQPLLHLLHEGGAVRSLRERRLEEERQYVCSVEARLYAPERHEAAKHQARADEQHERQGDFDHDDTRAQAASAAQRPGTAAGVPQHVHHVGS